MTSTYFKREVNLHDLNNYGLNEEVQKSMDIFDSYFNYRDEDNIYDENNEKTAEIEGSYFRICLLTEKLFTLLMDMDIVGDDVGGGDILKFLSERKFDIKIETMLLFRPLE